MGKVKIFDAATGKSRELDKIVKSDEEWQTQLTPEQFEITRQRSTEAPFTGVCPAPPGKEGMYCCVCCGTDLFTYGAKFESGTGWPSFEGPVSDLNIREVTDDSHGIHRTEVKCARCDAHLGHVFDDGPPPSHKRYCINAAALKLAR